MVEILGRTRIVFKIEEIGSKEDIKIVQKQQVAHIGNKTKRNLEMTPWKRELEECRLKVAKMHIIKRIEKEKYLLLDIGDKMCLRFLQVKYQKVIKRKNQRQNDKNY